MSELRFNHTATRLLDGRVLAAGGSSGPVPSAELYDPDSGRWTATGSMAELHFNHSATLLPDGTVLTLGGYYNEPLAMAEVYDARSGAWTAIASMTTPRIGHTATLLPAGRVLVVAGGGEVTLAEGPAYGATAEIYDPGTGRWTATASMGKARAGHTATLLPDGRVLVVGGSIGDDATGRSAELYDPSTASWTASGGMAEARSGHSATLLADGRVLVVGGVGLGSTPDPLVTAELYDPSTGRWTATGSMAEARPNRHTATLLPDGMILVTGAWNEGGVANDPVGRSAELYDPITGQWTATANMLVARVGPTATLLSDGTVLVAGGDFSGGPEDIASAEIYDPH